MTPKQSIDNGMQELQRAIKHWKLVEDGSSFHTPTSILQRVRTQGGAAYLKIALCEDEQRGMAALRWWNGHGTVRVLAAHANTVLLERACGERSLVNMSQTGQDAESTKIICDVATRLHTCVAAEPPDLLPLAQCFCSLTQSAFTQCSIFHELSEVANFLLATPQQVVILHGDLHHGNILDAGARGWLAIDPKGYIGERGFDFANLFCNPDHQTATHPECFTKRLRLVSKIAHIEPQRLLSWIAAWSGLSAAWHIEDGGNPDTPLAIGALALCALRH